MSPSLFTSYEQLSDLLLLHRAAASLPPSSTPSMDFNMSGSTEKPSKRRLPDQQPSNASAKKKQRNNVALAEAFLREDYSFRPPPGLREHMSGPASRPTKKTLPKKLTRPTKTNGRDPFQHLNDDEIHQIIRYLDAKDTETMRRVSKFWKATSEHHCSKSVLLQHLPWATSNDIDSLSNEELNIYYRRQCTSM